MHGIKGTPSDEIVGLCMKGWIDKYQLHMNKQELQLAFDLNILGELPKKVEHYQCFSLEFFANVCNEYLEQKKHVNQKAQQLQQQQPRAALPPVDMTRQLITAILADFKLICTDTPVEGYNYQQYHISGRLEMLGQLVEITLNEPQIADLRERAKTLVLNRLRAKKAALNPQSKIGAIVNLTNQIARLKTGKLLTQDDESAIQLEVTELLYFQTLLLYKPSNISTIDTCKFVQHLNNTLSTH